MPGHRVFLTADGTSLALEQAGTVSAEGRLSRDRKGWDLHVAGPADATLEPDGLGALLTGLVELARRLGGGPMRWLVRDPTALDDDAARQAGLHDVRDILQLRRPLPVGAAERAGVPAVATRPFRQGADDDRWLEVNNRAFANHPDQSDQTAADLVSLVGQPWFDAEGFLLLDAEPAGPRAGSLDGFCWTREHGDHDPPLGEIFVIGVDPSATGRGLGRALTIAGLDHLHDRGLRVGMLYTDADNAPAVAMYERLGFGQHHLDRMYHGQAEPAGATA